MGDEWREGVHEGRAFGKFQAEVALEHLTKLIERSSWRIAAFIRLWPAASSAQCVRTSSAPNLIRVLRDSAAARSAAYLGSMVGVLLKGRTKAKLSEADARAYGLAVAKIVAARKFSGHDQAQAKELKRKAKEEEVGEPWWEHMGSSSSAKPSFSE